MRNLGGMMRQVKDMQAKMKTLGEDMEASRFECSVGGGSVVAIVTGKGDIADLQITAPASTQEDMETLADMIKLAVNNARQQAEQKKAEIMKEMTGGLPLPPGMTLPF